MFRGTTVRNTIKGMTLRECNQHFVRLTETSGADGWKSYPLERISLAFDDQDKFLWLEIDER
jgi:hypothetical protein